MIQYNYVHAPSEKPKQAEWFITKYQPTDEFHNFVLQLKTKIEEKEGDVCMAAMSASAVANVAATHQNESASDLSYTDVTITRKPTYVCNYCNYEGHTSNRCFIHIKNHKKELWKNHEAEGWPTDAETYRRSQTHYNDTVPPKKPPKIWHAPAPPNK